MFKQTISTVLVAGLMGCVASPSTNLDATNGVSLVETVKKQSDELVIPYKKFMLDNGLTVILHEDNSDPLVHVDVTYHVGSGREEIGKSGFAHFFEHMMFQGSENVADEQHFKIISESGGTLNGTTNSDRTNYFETVPSNQLEKILWLESDRMGFLLDAVTQKKFEVQRETVKNERGQRVDNRPYGRLGERVAEALYPEGHPYSWPVIGYMEDLNRANVNDVKEFFLRWYGPNNATLTIGGDIDEAQTLAWVEKYFGSIPRGPEVKDPTPTDVSLEKDRYISLEDNVSLPLLYMAYPTVHRLHPDEAPLDVLASIIGQGKTSILYKNLVKNGVAVQSSVSHGCKELSCEFVLYALPNPMSGKSLGDLEAIIRDSFKEFEKRGVQADDIERVKSGIKSSLIYGLQSVSGKVSQLAANQTFEGNPNLIQKELERYENVTEADVMRVYNEYIKGEKAVIMSVVPEGQTGMVAHKDTWTPSDRNLPEQEKISAADLNIRQATDDFDRSVMPEAGENPTIKVPTIWRDELANGIDVLGAANTETPTTAIRLRIKAASALDPMDKIGLAGLTASMINQATENSSSEEISDRLQKLGSSISVSSGDWFTEINVQSLTENLDETLQIVNEKLRSPKFDPADFKRVKEQTIEGIKSAAKQPSVVASQTFRKLLFGTNNVFSHPNSGSVETIKNITLDDVKSYYKKYYTPKAASIIVVSDLEKDVLSTHLNRFSSWEGDSFEQPTLKTFPDLDKAIYFVNKPGAAQSEIRIGKRSLPYDVMGEYYRANLMNYNLGGAFNSRINLNLREDKGYTYGASSSFIGGEEYGYYLASASVKTDATDESITEFLNEIKSYKNNGMTEAELAFMKNSLGQRDARKYETPYQKISFLETIINEDLEPDFVNEKNNILQSIELDELNKLAQKHLLLEDMIIVVVGDKASVMPGLKKLGYDIIEVDAEANKL